jgi:hypothetical protein
MNVKKMKALLAELKLQYEQVEPQGSES